MRNLSFAIVIAAVASSVALAGEADFHNCGLCRPLVAEPGLMQNMRLETHEIATGMLSITVVAADFEAAYQRAHAKMMESVKKLEAGEPMELCPFCKSMNELAKAGAHIENVNAEGTHILAVTSDKPEVIEKIHAHRRWTKEEFEKMHAAPAHKG
jgi:hypothetical protein